MPVNMEMFPEQLRHILREIDLRMLEQLSKSGIAKRMMSPFIDITASDECDGWTKHETSDTMIEAEADSAVSDPTKLDCKTGTSNDQTSRVTAVPLRPNTQQHQTAATHSHAEDGHHLVTKTLSMTDHFDYNHNVPISSTCASRSNSLQHDLQTLSDLCLRCRLRPSLSHVAVLSDSIQRNVVTPLRRKLQTSSPHLNAFSISSGPATPSSFNPSALTSDYDDRYVASLATQLLRYCCLNPELDHGTLSLSALLDTLIHHLQTQAHVPSAFVALKLIWADVFSVLTGHLSRWLEHGVIQDPTSQFFISVEESPEASRLHVEPSKLPKFITRRMADMLIFTGTASKCASLLATPSPSPRTLANTSFSLDSTLTIHQIQQQPLSTPLILEAACVSWRAQAAHHLSRVLPFDSIAKRIRNLRDFLLQGNAAFWRSVFDDMSSKTQIIQRGGEITEEARKTTERALNRLLVSVAVDAQLDDDSPDDPDELGVSSSSPSRTTSPLILQIAEDGTLTPFFKLSLAETHVLGSSASVYCDAFAVTFGLRRTACKLREAFSHLLILERSIRYNGRFIENGNVRIARSSLDRLSGRTDSVKHIVTAIELRRRMMNFIECVEWHIQATVIQPKFDKLLNILENFSSSSLSSPSPQTEKESPPSMETTDFAKNRRHSPAVCPAKSFFDTVSETHTKLMNDLFKECFVADEPINIRLNTIFDICDNLSQFLCETTPESAMDPYFTETIANMAQEFSRNVQLFEQMLLIYNRDGDSKVGSLLVQLNYANNQ